MYLIVFEGFAVWTVMWLFTQLFCYWCEICTRRRWNWTWTIFEHYNYENMKKVCATEAHHITVPPLLVLTTIQTDLSAEVAVNSPQEAIAVSCAFFLFFLLCSCHDRYCHKILLIWSVNSYIYSYFHKQCTAEWCQRSSSMIVGCFCVVNRLHRSLIAVRFN